MVAPGGRRVGLVQRVVIRIRMVVVVVVVVRVQRVWFEQGRIGLVRDGIRGRWWRPRGSHCGTHSH